MARMIHSQALPVSHINGVGIRTRFWLWSRMVAWIVLCVQEGSEHHEGRFWLVFRHHVSSTADCEEIEMVLVARDLGAAKALKKNRALAQDLSIFPCA